MISGKDRTCGGNRIIFAENRVSCSDGRFRNGQACVHVAKIDDAHDLLMLRRCRPDKSVVIVGIAIDDATAEAVETRNSLSLELIQEMLCQSAPLGIDDSGEFLEGPERTAEVPFQNAVCCRVGKIQQGLRPSPQAGGRDSPGVQTCGVALRPMGNQAGTRAAKRCAGCHRRFASA